MAGNADIDIADLEKSLGDLPEPVLRPAFVMVSGLPGTGKSYFSRKLAQKHPFTIIESDAIRKLLFASPTYTAEESSHVFNICHRMIESLLKRGISVIFDATNLSEINREHLYHIGEKTGAKMVMVSMKVPRELVKERLELRKEKPHPEEKSDAGWEIYKKMEYNQQKIQRNFVSIDTSGEIDTYIDKVRKMIKR